MPPLGDPPATRDQALSGLRIVDLTDQHGQYCAKLLADLGADVIKVEPPQGDTGRFLPPFKDDHPHPEKSLFFAYRNANKRSLALDLDRAEGLSILFDLLRTADGVVHTWESSPLRRAGVSYHQMQALNPRLVVASLSGAGEAGAYSRLPWTGSAVFALSGLMRKIGEDNGPPVAPPEALVFDLAAVDAALGMLCALLARRWLKRGQEVRVSALEVLASQFNPERPHPTSQRRTANQHPELAPSGVYACRDGRVELTIVMPGQWHHLKELLGNPPGLAAEEWTDRDYRTAHSQVLVDAVQRAVGGWWQQELVQRAQAAQVPCLAVNDVDAFVRDRHVEAREFFVASEHPYLGSFQTPGAPYRMSEAGWRLARSAPTIGEDTATILVEELGYAAERTAELATAGIIRTAVTGASRPRLRASGEVGSAAHSPIGEGLPPPKPGNTAPLSGIRVLEFTTAFAGPTLGRYLADLGAEVIKVESLRRPDNTRQHGSGAREPNGAPTSENFSSFNRNKLDIALDLSQAEGRTIARRLVELSDIVLENFSRRVLPGWGLDYAGLCSIRPDIILLDMQGTGQTGPYRDYVTYGPTLHSFTGLTSLWGYSHASFIDYVAAAHGAVAVLAAVLYRSRTGRGMQIDLAQAEAAAALLGTEYLSWTVNGRAVRGLGNRSLAVAPYGCYRCAGEDAWLVLAATGDEQWQVFRQQMGHPAWTHDIRFATNTARLEHGADLDERIGEWTQHQDARSLERKLQGAGIVAVAVRSAGEAKQDPCLRSQGFYQTLDHPVLGQHELAGLTIHLSETPGQLRRAGPLLGEDNGYVLSTLLKLSATEVADLLDRGVLA